MITGAEARRIVKSVLRGRRDPELDAAAWGGMRVALAKWDGQRSFERWARYVIGQHISNQYRAWRTARHTAGLLDDVSRTVVGADAQRDPLLRRAVARALDELPPRQARAAVLYWVDGMTGADAAEELGVTPQAATQLVHRARVRLQRSLRTAYREMSR